MNSTSNTQILIEDTMPFSWAYRQHAHPSYWGPITSAHNFCEQDFIITQYIAEFINTLTNLTYCYYAYHGIKGNKNRKDAVLRNFPYLGIAGVGIGSAIFHATLKNYTQWCDDLSMLIAGTAVLHRVYTFDKSLTFTVLYSIATITAVTAFSAWHCITNELTMHSIFFAFIIFFVGLKTQQIIGERVKDENVRREVRRLTNWGSVIFISGFLIWIMDNQFCGSLTTWKRSMGMPWSFVLELHGWWHIFTGVGAYIFIALVEYLTSEEAGQPLGNRFAFPVGFIINPHAGKKELLSNGHSNGHVAVNGVANGDAKKEL